MELRTSTTSRRLSESPSLPLPLPLPPSFSSTSKVSGSTATSKAVEQLNSNSMNTIYFNPKIVAEEKGIYHAARYRKLEFGPFHSSFGPIPKEATLVRQIKSPIAISLLASYENLALPFATPPTTIEMPDILDNVTEWEENYPTVLHGVCLVARKQWKELREDCEKYSTWGDDKLWVEKMDYFDGEEDLAEWEEMTVYLQIDRLIHKSYLLWCDYSIKCIISMGYAEMIRIHDASFNYNEMMYRLFPFRSQPQLFPLPSRPTLHTLAASAPKSYHSTIIKYTDRPSYDNYPPPLKPLNSSTSKPSRVLLSAIVIPSEAPKSTYENSELFLPTESRKPAEGEMKHRKGWRKSET